jgi:hypothetical protein
MYVAIVQIYNSCPGPHVGVQIGEVYSSPPPTRELNSTEALKSFTSNQVSRAQLINVQAPRSPAPSPGDQWGTKSSPDNSPQEKKK